VLKDELTTSAMIAVWFNGRRSSDVNEKSEMLICSKMNLDCEVSRISLFEGVLNSPAHF
jgi:hypothetical protein